MRKRRAFVLRLLHLLRLHPAPNFADELDSRIAHDPATIAAVCLLLAASGLIAALIPAAAPHPSIPFRPCAANSASTSKTNHSALGYRPRICYRISRATHLTLGLTPGFLRLRLLTRRPAPSPAEKQPFSIP